MKDLITSILERAVEDYTGLWELLPLDTSGLSSSSADSCPAVRAEVQELLKRGWITLFRGISFNGDEKVVDSEIDEILRDKHSWQVPEGFRVHFRIGATVVGERAYYGGTQDN